ncbi:MAG: NAD(P)H-dependent glycerol-3-phosphate dehydrogenase [Bacillota bacterium]|nr:NAD(P)H-dependent glycerol-3-phosphate dehydrogenase [Bacillota bacterium]
MKSKICIIGAGSMGSALSVLVAGNGHSVRMWSCFKEEVDMINNLREHTSKLPGVKIPEGVTCTDDIEYALNEADAVLFVIPSQTVRQNAKMLARLIKDDMVIACFAKGLEDGTGYRMSEVISEEIPQARVVALSGPCHAEELARGVPSAYVSSSKNQEAAKKIQDILMSENFRVYTNTDITGVELGGALKNVIALCAGISDGLGFGDNTKAALMTRGIIEMSRLGTAMGAEMTTFSGLTGIGDLIVTCTSMHSRNRRAGILIGQGKSVKEALDEVKMVVEGVATTKVAYEISKKMGISMPITSEAYKVVYEGKNARKAVVDLMTRDKKEELEAL